MDLTNQNSSLPVFDNGVVGLNITSQPVGKMRTKSKSCYIPVSQRKPVIRDGEILATSESVRGLVFPTKARFFKADKVKLLFNQ